MAQHNRIQQYWLL